MLWGSKSHFGFLVEEMPELEHNKELPRSRHLKNSGQIQIRKFSITQFRQKDRWLIQTS